MSWITVRGSDRRLAEKEITAVCGSAARSKQGIGEIIGPSRLAKHLDLTYPRIYQLVEEQVIAKLPNAKFDQDACRVAYLRWLRAPERRTLRIKADADFIAAKPELIAIRVQEKSAS